MCIIITKEKNAEPLPEEIFDIIWTNNPDGGGILYHDGKKAVLKKGMMKRDEFLTAAKAVNKKGISYIMHTRIATHGSVKPENTHPFVSKTLGFAHNGTFNVEPFPDKTDSETFFIGSIANKSFKWCEDNKFLLDMATNGCRCAVMDLKTGTIMHLCEGDWKTDIKYKGYKFSNTGYQSITRYSYLSATTSGDKSYSYKDYRTGYFDDDWYDDYDNYGDYEKYGKISKKESLLVDDIKMEQFIKTRKAGLRVDPDWAKTYLETYAEKAHTNEDTKQMSATMTAIARELADIIAYDGKDTYEYLACSALLSFVGYASAQGYKKIPQVLTSFDQMIEDCQETTGNDKFLIAELKSQLKEWK